MPGPMIPLQFLNTEVPLLFELFGLNVPCLSFGIGLLCLIGGVWILLRDYKRIRHLKKQISRLIEAIPQNAEHSKAVSKTTIETLYSAFTLADTPDGLKGCWLEFNETLIKDEMPDGKVFYHNTSQAEQVFTPQFVYDELPKITTALPGLATGLGLLGTFLALLFGLMNLHVVNGGEVQGIAEFINALSGKFVSSICGLGVALGATFYISWQHKSVDKNLHKLHHALNRLFPRRTTEEMLLELNRELKSVNKAVCDVADNMSAKLPDVIKESVTPEIAKLFEAINGLSDATQAMKDLNAQQLNAIFPVIQQIESGINKLQSQNSDAITESIRKMLEEFKRTMHESSGAEMAQLAASMQQAAKVMQAIGQRADTDAQRQQEVDRQFAELVRVMKEASQQQGSTLSDSLARMAQLMEAMQAQAGQMSQQGRESIQEQLTRMAKHQETISKRVELTMEGMIQRMGVTQREHQETHQQQQGEINQQLQTAIQQLSTVMTEQMQHLGTQRQQVTQQVDGLLQTVSVSGQQHSQQLQQVMAEAAQKMAEATERQLTAYQEKQTAAHSQMESTLNKLTSLLDSREAGLHALSDQTQQAQQKLIEVLSKGVSDFDQSARTLKDSLNQTLTGFEQLRQGQSLLKDTMAQMQTLHVDVLNSTQAASDTAEKYDASIQAMMALHDRQEVVYTTLDSTLGNILNTVTRNINEYQMVTNERLKENLQDWDTLLRQASDTFKGVFIELKDNTEELKESTEDLPAALIKITELVNTVR